MKHLLATKRFSATELIIAMTVGIILVAGTVSAVTVPPDNLRF